jgi:S-formylglutathione hydrolase FrmB
MQTSDTPTLPAGENQRRLAVLIDADNAQPSVIEGLLAEIAKFGVAGVKRIYGDWTSTKHAQWKVCLLNHSIAPIQQFAYTNGKNATDSSMIIDAMDLMHSQRLDGFCLVSSDSDFTRLAQRLREAGLLVYGFGEQKTPKPFVVACDKFIYTEVLRKAAPSAPEVSALTQPASASMQAAISLGPVATGETNLAHETGAKLTKAQKSPVSLLSQAIEQGADESGWAFLGAVGNYLTKIQPDFDQRLYGCQKLSELIRKYPEVFETSERGAPGSPSKVMYARLIAPKDPAKRAG